LCPGKCTGDLKQDWEEAWIGSDIGKRGWWTIRGNNIAVGIAAHKLNIWKRCEAIQHGDRLRPERDKVAKNPIVLNSAVSLNVGKNRIKGNHVAVNV
jgi:hypothetical protein